MTKIYAIGPLELDAEARVLSRDGVPTALGARGVAVLAVLVSRANEYVPKTVIMETAWPGLVVEEGNLNVQISLIRRTLALVPGGGSWIETLTRRGYRFVGPVAEIGGRSVAPVAADRRRTNLPESLTAFVGRERELAEIKQRLPATRMLTLTGTGGIGKTRLALQAAAEVRDAYRDGVWFVDLAPLRDAALVPSALAQVLQLKEMAGQPLLTVLCNHLRTKQMLLILDNCEHLLDACAQLTEALLRETVQVTLIATSREPLRLNGERVHPLSALPLPDPKGDARSIARSDAVQLFVERARQQRPRFDLQDERARAVALICVRLDGIPLALELAAARVAVLPVEEIVRLLDKRFRLLTSGGRELPRHQTLRAMIDWSYELLDRAEKVLFARLSVFAGGWTLEAAREVCSSESIAKDDVVYLLIRLIEQSLVVADEDGDRYRMLETVREYAQEKREEPAIGDGSREQWRDRHLAYFLALAEEAAPRLNGAQQRNWLERLEREHDNLRWALTWAAVGGDAVSGMRLASACWRFWLIRGYAREGLGRLSAMLAATPNQEATEYRAAALSAAATMARAMSDFSKAGTLYEEALSLYREFDLRRGVAAALGNLGMVFYDQGDYLAAMARQEESLSIWRELGDQQGIARTLMALGNVVYSQGAELAAESLYKESLGIERELGDQRAIAVLLNNLGMVAAYYRNDYSAARLLHEEALVIRRELGDRWGIAGSLTNLGTVAYELGDHLSSRALLTESLAMRRDLAHRLGIAESLEALAGLEFAAGRPGAGARICGQAARLRKEIGSPLPPWERSRYDRQIASGRAAIGNDVAFDLAWQEGHAMTLEQAIEYALQEQRADD
jgi:predicted ATPase/DNA-binding winged helix-turn-helix (wHTH) protein